MNYNNQRIDNRLINRFNNNNQNSMNIYQNNPLLRSNLNNNFNGQNSSYLQNMQKIKEMEKLKRIEALNELEKKYGKDKIKNIIIQPTKVDISFHEKRNQKDKISVLEKEYNPKDQKHLSDLKGIWNKRTNLPYKNITDKKHHEQFQKKEKLHNLKEEELIIHKVTNADKKGVKQHFSKIEKNRKDYNKELEESIYSVSKEAENKKKFEYNHKYKFRLSHKPSDHTKMKKDTITMYKKEQKKMEESKMKKDNILEALISDNNDDNENNNDNNSDNNNDNYNENRINNVVNNTINNTDNNTVNNTINNTVTASSNRKYRSNESVKGVRYKNDRKRSTPKTVNVIPRVIDRSQNDEVKGNIAKKGVRHKNNTTKPTYVKPKNISRK